ACDQIGAAAGAGGRDHFDRLGGVGLRRGGGGDEAEQQCDERFHVPPVDCVGGGLRVAPPALRVCDDHAVAHHPLDFACGEARLFEHRARVHAPLVASLFAL